MFTIIIFIVLLGLLIFAHELGHFLVARRNGIKADEFGFGFPPRLAGLYKSKDGKWHLLIGDKEVNFSKTLKRLLGGLTQARSEFTEPTSENASELVGTIYSINWLPLGGFVRIKGEDGENTDSDSFAQKSAWSRIRVLGAGVFANFLFAWFLISIVLTLGLPQPIAPAERAKYPDAKIQILEVKKDTPAQAMGLSLGDEILAINEEKIISLKQVSDTIVANKGKEIAMRINRLGKELVLAGTPRVDYPAGEGSLGISFGETAVVSYPFYEAIYRGAIAVYNITLAILQALGGLIASLFGAGTGAPIDIAGPVGIVYLTKQVSDLGIAYLLQFAALLSINLAIINILPFPALDGGRILFVLIEKFKGSPVSRKTEGMIHQIGFILLLLLMVVITARDLSAFQIFEKIGGFFS